MLTPSKRVTAAQEKGGYFQNTDLRDEILIVLPCSPGAVSEKPQQPKHRQDHRGSTPCRNQAWNILTGKEPPPGAVHTEEKSKVGWAGKEGGYWEYNFNTGIEHRSHTDCPRACALPQLPWVIIFHYGDIFVKLRHKAN